MPLRTPNRNKVNVPLSFFDVAYQKLNGDQKKAVDRIEGPVMVIAGPGTGKTQVLAMRVAQILQKTHMRPGNILCLTFSVSGVTAMRERLKECIGVDAFGVTINTTHGFCNDLIQHHPQVFEEWQALEQISDSERVREMNKIIDQKISHFKLLNKKYPYSKTSDILGRISQLKREGMVDAERLHDIAAQYEILMSGRFKDGTKAKERDLLRADKFKDFLILFFGYQEMLERTRRYDYEDMLLYVLKALREEEWLLASLQERYQYILVDEFQDLNGAQYALIEKLTTYPTLDHEPNLFVVGDDDQAIYRFQGANIQNMVKFYERFPQAPVIALTTSYRCSQPILNAAGSLIAHNTERLVGKISGLQKELRAVDSIPRRGRVRQRGFERPNIPPRLIYCATDTQEPFLIADIVSEQIASGILPNQIAILTQTNRELFAIYDALQSKEIPVHMHGKLDLLAHSKVNQVVAILKAVQSPQESSLLAAAIGCSCFDIHPADLGRLFAVRRERQQSLLDVLLSVDQPGTGTVPVYYHDITSLIRARDTILDLQHKLGSRTVVETTECLLKESGLLSHPIDPLDYIPLYEFFTRIKYRAYEQPGFSFEILLSDIDLARDPSYPDCRLTYEIPGLKEQGVQLMTAHQSKGLEFDTIILPSFKEGHWDRRRHPPSIEIPEDLLFGWGAEKKSFEQSQDERRVAYVAITRARHEVMFTCPKEIASGNKVRPISSSGFSAECENITEEQKEEISMNIFPHIIRDLDSELKAFLRARLEHFDLSVTALNHFLEDPNIFLERDLLQVPQAKNSSLTYGNAVHAALRVWGISAQRRKPMDIEGFLNAFRTYLTDREVLTEKERKRLKILGETSLPRYFMERLSSHAPHVHSVESPMSARMGDIPLRGQIDRIDTESPDSRVASIIDFKTGRPKTEAEIRSGDYYRQLVFYALLFEHSRPLLRPARFILDFVGEGEYSPVLREFEVTSSDKALLEQQIKDVWKKITSLDFSPL